MLGLLGALFLSWWRKDTSQRALQPININTGTLEFLASLSLYLSLCVYLSLSSLGDVDSVSHQLSENIWFERKKEKG